MSGSTGPGRGALSAPCDGDICITCSDQLLTVHLEWVSEDALVARGTFQGAPCEVSVELLDDPCPGDMVLVHGGVALQRASTPATAEARR